MATIIDKANGRLTYEDYCNQSDQKRCELIEGQIFDMTPAPSRYHQDIHRELFLKIGNFLKENPCTIYSSPFDVRLYDSPSQPDSQISTVVQPDIVVICDQSKLDEKGCRGAPDLVIEISSPESTVRDTKTKLSLYEKHKIKEYWIVNSSEKTISVFNINEQGHYSKPSIFKESDIVKHYCPVIS